MICVSFLLPFVFLLYMIGGFCMKLHLVQTNLICAFVIMIYQIKK